MSTFSTKSCCFAIAVFFATVTLASADVKVIDGQGIEVGALRSIDRDNETLILADELAEFNDARAVFNKKKSILTFKRTSGDTDIEIDNFKYGTNKLNYGEGSPIKVIGGKPYFTVGSSMIILKQLLKKDVFWDDANKYFVLGAEKPVRTVDVKIDTYAVKIKSDKVRIIVIDAGHGGKDPGAIGKRGLKEKDVNLDVAVKLAKMLESKIDANIILTRSVDEFLPLSERARIANDLKADLFICVHANASRNRESKGTEVYIYGQATDEDAGEVERRENIDVDYAELIIYDLIKTAQESQNLELAGKIQTSLVSALSTNNNGVKKARFYVLAKTTMPGVLVEMAYVSNRHEEEKLRDPDERTKAAEGILNGILKHINSLSKHENGNGKSKVAKNGN